MRKAEIPDVEEQLEYLKNVRDEDIDFSDISEIRPLQGAVRGKFYRPAASLADTGIDADVLAWFRSHYPEYQSAINRVLRDYMTGRLKATPE